MGKADKDSLQAFFEKTARIVDPKIKEVLGLSVDKKTQELLNYQIEAGGKRLRPILAALSCLVCGGKLRDVLYPAAGLEILHTCTLIYDDIIDHSNFRRGKPTNWFKFGKSIAECVGMDYSAASFYAAGQSKKPAETSRLFAAVMKTIVEGEILDILFEQSGREDEKYVLKNRYKTLHLRDYLNMVSKKTASLFQACCEIGAISASATTTQKKALKNYGFHLGVGFQIKDDILDIFGKEKKFGKKIGHDIKERKLGNIVIFFALQELSITKRRKLLTILRKKQIKEKDIQEAIELIKETGAKEKSLSLGGKYVKKAKLQLKSLPPNKWNGLLDELADFIMARNK